MFLDIMPRNSKKCDYPNRIRKGKAKSIAAIKARNKITRVIGLKINPIYRKIFDIARTDLCSFAKHLSIIRFSNFSHIL